MGDKSVLLLHFWSKKGRRFKRRIHFLTHNFLYTWLTEGEQTNLKNLHFAIAFRNIEKGWWSKPPEVSFTLFLFNSPFRFFSSKTFL